MKNVKVSDTRNFALVGHAGDGKTSLGEAILHKTGAGPTLGSVTDGSSVLNFLPEEKERHTTITSSVYAFDWRDHAPDPGRHPRRPELPGGRPDRTARTGQRRSW